jgi:aminoglycoside 6'-N-acetyltransferase
MSLVRFRSLRRSDFPQLKTWLEMPHVARWWNHETAPEALERDFGPSLDGTDPAELFIAMADDIPCGFLQRYSYADNPGYLRDVSTIVDVAADAFSIDYFIGEPAMLRRGWGTSMIRAGLAALWRDEPSAPSVVVPVSTANAASMRLLERAGFHAAAYGALEPDNPIDGSDHVIYRIHRPRP